MDKFPSPSKELNMGLLYKDNPIVLDTLRDGLIA